VKELRDIFAVAAMQAMLGSREYFPNLLSLAHEAYAMADLMLRAREEHDYTTGGGK